MNYLDIIIAVPLLYALIKGFYNGLIKEVAAFVALAVGVYVAINFSLYLEPKIASMLQGYEQIVSIIAFLILFLVSILCVKVLGFIIDKLTKALALGILSRFLGGFFGVLKILVFFSFLMFVTADYSLINKKIKDDSILYKPLSNIATIITPKIREAAEKTKEKINQQTISQ